MLAVRRHRAQALASDAGSPEGAVPALDVRRLRAQRRLRVPDVLHHGLYVALLHAATAELGAGAAAIAHRVLPPKGGDDVRGLRHRRPRAARASRLRLRGPARVGVRPGGHAGSFCYVDQIRELVVHQGLQACKAPSEVPHVAARVVLAVGEARAHEGDVGLGQRHELAQLRHAHLLAVALLLAVGEALLLQMLDVVFVRDQLAQIIANHLHRRVALAVLVDELAREEVVLALGARPLRAQHRAPDAVPHIVGQP
mmetsp:Transcript_79178/g.203954  ORF Transcript_79178/g.203954 Transcript_79178/m.203954 type:complete len:255 (-) Transcript_79178:2243-3007(-)